MAGLLARHLHVLVHAVSHRHNTSLVSAWLAAFSLVAFVASANAGTTVDSESYDLNISRGLLEFSRGHYEKAEPLLSAALDAKPGDPEAGYYLAQTLLRLKKYEAAEGIFRKLLEGDPASGRAWLGLGIVQYNRGQYADALVSLAAAEKASPTEPLVHYYMGLIYNELEAFEKSPEKFHQAMALSPDLAPSAQYYSGVAYYRRGIFDKAQAEFEAVIATQPESELARSAKEFLSETRAAPPKGLQRLNATFTLSSEWDSNVVVIPNGTSPPGGATGISQQSDYRTVLYAHADLRPIQTGTWTAGLASGVYQSFHRTLHGFDVLDFSPTAYIQHQLGPLQTSIQYIFSYTDVGREPYLVAHGAQPYFTLAEGGRAFTQVQLRYQYKDFKDNRFPTNSGRDGINWLAGVTQYLLFMEDKGRARVGFTYDTDRTGGGSPSVAPPPGGTNASDWSYNGYRVSTGLELPSIIWKLNCGLAFDYNWVNYLNPNSFSGDGLTPRRDRIIGLTGALSRALTEHFLLTFQYSYTREQSNVAAFDYNRSIYSLSLTGRF
ncbi:MAG: tetratricopeptide repeat protein [Nitrospiraceae bacterium]